MVTLRPYEFRDRQRLAAMLSEYFNRDLDEPLPPERLRAVLAQLEYDMEIYPIYMSVLEAFGELIGFIIFQADTPDNPWGLRPGWGFIREVYVQEEFRCNGLGKAMTKTAMGFLRDAGITKVYLTSATDRFWKSLGFVPDGEVCEKNGLEIYHTEIGDML